MRLIPSAAFLSAFTLLAGLAQADTVLSITTDGNAETVAAMDALTAEGGHEDPDMRALIARASAAANFMRMR